MDKPLLDSDPSLDEPVAGPSDPSLDVPAYQEIVDETHFNTDDPFIPPGGEEPPPDFTPYEAEYFKGSYGEIISHDPHLNEDGEALYRFILAHSQRPPTYLLRIRGRHTERRSHEITRTDSDGRTVTETEWRTVDVTDFHFYLDIGQYISYGPVHFSLADEEPAYRGKMYQETDGTFPDRFQGLERDLEMAWVDIHRRQATSGELKRAKKWRKEQESHGLPPWIGPDANWSVGDRLMRLDRDHVNVMKSSRTVRQWADEYCASNRYFKEFTYKKVVYGWDTEKLKDAITAVIHSSGYHHTIAIAFELTEAEIHVRPSTELSRMLSNKWWTFFLVITLIYPFLWLYMHFSGQGGGKWQVCGGAYALKAWRPSLTAQDTDDSADRPPYSANPPSLNLKDGAGRVVETGEHGARLKLVGVREGEWFQQWEGMIRQAVKERRISNVPIVSPQGQTADAPVIVRPDGYQPYESEV